jgi:hypothetical protein
MGELGALQGVVQQANIRPATEANPPMQPAAPDLREREFAFRQASEISKSRQIARMSAWKMVIDTMNTSPYTLEEKLGRIVDGKLGPAVEKIYADVLLADAVEDEYPGGGE